MKSKFNDVEAQAEKAGKEPKFMPSAPTDKLVGKCPATNIYNV
jgi:catalase